MGCNYLETFFFYFRLFILGDSVLKHLENASEEIIHVLYMYVYSMLKIRIFLKTITKRTSRFGYMSCLDIGTLFLFLDYTKKNENDVSKLYVTATA